MAQMIADTSTNGSTQQADTNGQGFQSEPMSESAIPKSLRDYLAGTTSPSPFGVSLGFSASYIRVLLSDASPFGEKAARNIEQLTQGCALRLPDQAHR